MNSLAYPVGKGYFVWQLERCAGGDPGRLAAAAVAAGVHWVSFKIHNGTATRNGDIAVHVRALAAAGVASWGWGYCYGWAAEAEARLAIARCAEFGLAGYMLNAEKEYKEPGMWVSATKAMMTFKREAAGLPIGLCSYRFPSLHRSLPWAEFLTGCSFHCPQVYWLENNADGAPTLQLGRALAELRALRDLPVVPLGVSSPNDAGTWRPTVAQLDNFHGAVQAAGLTGHGWWSYEHAERERTWWAAITRHSTAAPTPTPADTGLAGHARAILGLVS